MRAISTPCILTSLRSRTDGSLGLSFSTPELTAEEKTVWFQLQNKNCKMLLEPQDVDDEPPIEVRAKLETKTPSQRQRALLFLIFKEQGAVGSFDSFYSSRMDKICDKLRDELDSLK